MEWQQLEYFHMVAELQHFTKAAERLAISQPALSRSIAQLEHELGVPLFDRQGRSVVLNVFGKEFHGHAARILQEMKDAKRNLLAMQDPGNGNISLAFLKSLGIRLVPDMVRSYLDVYPQVNFAFHQNSTAAMMEQLSRGEIDFCLSSLMETPAEIQWKPLWAEEMFIFAHPEHVLASKGTGTVELRELVEQTFITLKQGYGSRVILDNMFGLMNSKPIIAFESDEVVSLLGFVSANLGIALLPRISGVNIRDIVQLSIVDHPCRRVIGLAWRKGKYMPPVATAFRDFVIDRYGSFEG